jgi:uncharacterized integral membrane protein
VTFTRRFPLGLRGQKRTLRATSSAHWRVLFGVLLTFILLLFAGLGENSRVVYFSRPLCIFPVQLGNQFSEFESV